MDAGAVGFWSYVQQDNSGDHGRILALAEDLRDQYRIQTAESLELFIDRDSIEWGEAWEQRINDAIAGTTFFIPIITPSYFRSNACRQELLKFVREAERLGLEQLLMSVYWATVPELHDNVEESADKAIQAVAEYQWQDLREERFEERDSAAYRRAVADLATEIAKRAAGAETVDDIPKDADAAVVGGTLEEADDGPGLIERIAAGEDAMERITELIEKIGGDIQRVGETVSAASEEIEAAGKRGQGMKAALALTNRLAGELEEPSESLEGHGLAYAKALAELDPGIHAWLDLIEAETTVSSEHDAYLTSIEDLAAVSDEALDSLQDLVNGAQTMATFSRSLRGPVTKMRKGLQGVLDGRAIMSDWDRRAREVREMVAQSAADDASPAEPDSAEEGQLDEEQSSP